MDDMNNLTIPSFQECCKMFDIVDAYQCESHMRGWTWTEAVEYIQKHWNDEDFNCDYSKVLEIENEWGE